MLLASEGDDLDIVGHSPKVTFMGPGILELSKSLFHQPCEDFHSSSAGVARQACLYLSIVVLSPRSWEC